MRLAHVLPVVVSGLILLGCTRSPSPEDPAGTPDAAPASGLPAEPAGPPAPPDPSATLIDAGFDCGGLAVSATFDNVAETATLAWHEGQLVLPQAISASGARYADTDGNEFWNKGNEATLTLAGNAPVQCTLAPHAD